MMMFFQIYSKSRIAHGQTRIGARGIVVVMMVRNSCLAMSFLPVILKDEGHVNNLKQESHQTRSDYCKIPSKVSLVSFWDFVLDSTCHE